MNWNAISFQPFSRKQVAIPLLIRSKVSIFEYYKTLQVFYNVNEKEYYARTKN